jgi:hypothetical protein
LVSVSEIKFAEFEILTAASVKMAALWAAAPCSLVKFSDVSEALAAPIIRAFIVLKMEAASIFETSLNFYQNTRCYNPEDGHL